MQQSHPHDGGEAGTAEMVPASLPERAATILVWDLALRTFHWLLVVGVAVAWLTGGTGSRAHELAGSVVTALLIFRLLWGFSGTVYARFSAFVRSPATLLHYLKDILRNRAARHIGHNPAGGYMILALIICLAVISITGVMQLTNAFFGVVWVETLHHFAANTLLVLIPLHVLGVIVSSWMHQENLVAAMISGHKPTEHGAHEPLLSLHQQMLTRIQANQGFSLLLFLLAAGLYLGWNATSGRAIATAIDTTSAPVVAVVQAVQEGSTSQARDKQDYVTGGPEAASSAWLISSGGRLYDNWYASLGKKGPTDTHPSWPSANDNVSGAATWRCKSCHGWDYAGRDGQYRSGANATGIVGLQRMRGRDPAQIVATLSNATHAFTDDMLPQHAKYRIALFVSKGQHTASQYVLANGKIKGDPEQGKPIFQSICASCHGFDGRARKLGASSDNSDSGYKGDPLFVGTKANAGPTEVLHKIRNGHPGAIMVSLRPFPMDVAANLLAYAQTLPTK